MAQVRVLWSACLLDADACAVPLCSFPPVSIVTVPPSLCTAVPSSSNTLPASCAELQCVIEGLTPFLPLHKATPQNSVLRPQQALLWPTKLHLSALSSDAGHDQWHQYSLISQGCSGHCVTQCVMWCMTHFLLLWILVIFKRLMRAGVCFEEWMNRYQWMICINERGQEFG